MASVTPVQPFECGDRNDADPVKQSRDWDNSRSPVQSAMTDCRHECGGEPPFFRRRLPVRREKQHNVRSIFVTAIPFAEDVPSEELTNSEEKFACFGFGTLEPSWNAPTDSVRLNGSPGSAEPRPGPNRTLHLQLSCEKLLTAKIVPSETCGTLTSPGSLGSNFRNTTRPHDSAECALVAGGVAPDRGVFLSEIQEAMFRVTGLCSDGYWRSPVPPRCPVVLARGDLASTCWRVGLQTLKVRTTFGSMVRYHPAPLASDGDKCGKQACSTNVFSAHICTCVASKFSSARFHAHSLLPCRNASRWLRQETMIHAERCQQACDCPGCRHPRVRAFVRTLG
ncbi:hypothetical protein L1887_43435 [Cichorium endivia]|nr:hypothetical protein L1887_43435 [Cichorium endivia]